MPHHEDDAYFSEIVFLCGIGADVGMGEVLIKGVRPGPVAKSAKVMRIP